MARSRSGLGGIGLILSLIGAILIIIDVILAIVGQSLSPLSNTPGISNGVAVGSSEVNLIVTLVLAIILLFLSTGRLDVDEPIILGILIIVFGWILGGFGGLLAVIGGILLVIDGLL